MKRTRKQINTERRIDEVLRPAGLAASSHNLQNLTGRHAAVDLASIGAPVAEDTVAWPDGTPKPSPLPEGAGFAVLLDVLRPWSFTIRASIGGMEFSAWDGDEMLAVPVPCMRAAEAEVDVARVAYLALWRALSMRHGNGIPLVARSLFPQTTIGGPGVAMTVESLDAKCVEVTGRSMFDTRGEGS
jgi:hypothetical protein